MGHERSETLQAPYTGGRGAKWINVYGKGTKHAGKPLPIKYGFESPAYATVQEAEMAARKRSRLEGDKHGKIVSQIASVILKARRG